MNALERSDVFFASQRAPSQIIAAQPAPRGRDGKINPHVTRFLFRDHRISDLFHVKPIYYETREGFWRPLSEIVSHHGNRRIVLKPRAMGCASLRFLHWLMKRQAQIGGILEFGYPDTFYWGIRPRDLHSALTLTAFPDPDPEIATMDGFVTKEAGSWAATRDAADGDSTSTSGSSLVITAAYRASTTRYTVTRTFLFFDTSTIGAADTITAATLDLFVTDINNRDNDGDDYVSLVVGGPASHTSLIVSDFNNLGSVEFGNQPDLSALTDDAYNTITLNATGLNAIVKADVSGFALREGHDLENSAPVDLNNVTWRSADFAGTSSDPKLTVTYTAAAVGTDIGGAFFF